MKTAQYLIIGGGMTAAAVADGIRSLDSHGSIIILSDEAHPPYNRPSLSKGLWKGKPVEKIWRKISPVNTEVLLGRRAVSIEPDRKIVSDDRGEVYAYQKLMLATGGSPRRLPFGGDSVTYYRYFEDYERLRSLTGPDTRFGVIGAGFIGSEIAAALRMNGQQVVMVFPEEGVGANIFPPDLSAYVTQYYRDRGVEMMIGNQVTGIRQDAAGTAIQTDQAGEIRADHVVAGIGILPNTALAEAAGLEVDNGIVVDAYLRTRNPDIFAAGDVANFYSPALQRRMRVEHKDNALEMGKTAGINMAGGSVAYTHIPFFYSDLFDLGYEAVGQLRASATIIEDWRTPYQEGTLYYLEGERISGVLLWNVWGQVDNARQLIGKEASQVQELIATMAVDAG